MEGLSRSKSAQGCSRVDVGGHSPQGPSAKSGPEGRHTRWSHASHREQPAFSDCWGAPPACAPPAHCKAYLRAQARVVHTQRACGRRAHAQKRPRLTGDHVRVALDATSTSAEISAPIFQFERHGRIRQPIDAVARRPNSTLQWARLAAPPQPAAAGLVRFGAGPGRLARMPVCVPRRRGRLRSWSSGPPDPHPSTSSRSTHTHPTALGSRPWKPVASCSATFRRRPRGRSRTRPLWRRGPPRRWPAASARRRSARARGNRRQRPRRAAATARAPAAATGAAL